MNGRDLNHPSEEQPTLMKRILSQVLRLALIALFIYIMYLGFMWRRFPKATPPQIAPPAEQSIPPSGKAR